MKYFLLLLAVISISALTACSTAKSVANEAGQGKKRVYQASYDPVWKASIDAAQQGDLQIVSSDRASGYIGARRGLHLETFGENVGIWVRRVAGDQTEVEVLSRQAGPPVLWFRNWENRILTSVEANLTRNVSSGIIADPSGVQIPRGQPVIIAPTLPTDAATEEQLRQERLRRGETLPQ